MTSLLCLCLLLAMCLSGSLAQDDGYETFPSVNGSQYKLYTLHLTWGEALSLCQGDGGGSHLAVINSQEEADVVRDMFDRITDPDVLYLYTGINDLATEGTWRTIQGDLVSTSGYDLWSAGQPENSVTAEDCGLVDRRSFYFDYICTPTLPFICEKPDE